MDPTVAIVDALSACARNDKVRAAEEFESLGDWFRRGPGFPPDLSSVLESLADEDDDDVEIKTNVGTLHDVASDIESAASEIRWASQRVQEAIRAQEKRP